MDILEPFLGIPPPGEYPLFTLNDGVVRCKFPKDNALRRLEIGKPLEHPWYGIFTVSHVINSLALMLVKLPTRGTIFEVVLSSYESTTIMDGHVHRAPVT